MRRLLFAFTLLSLLSWRPQEQSNTPAPLSVRYKIIVIGKARLPHSIYPYDINEQGQVVGTNSIPEADQSLFAQNAFFYEDGKTSFLRDLGGDDSAAVAINNREDVVGDTQSVKRFGLGVADTIEKQCAVIWPGGYIENPEERDEDVPLSLSEKEGAVYGINDNRDMVGSLKGRAVLWSYRKPSRISAPRYLDGAHSNNAQDINLKGEIVGSYLRYSQGSWNSHACYWPHGKAKRIELSALGGECSGSTAINANGWIVGWAETANRAERACLWRDGKPVDLGTLEKGKSVALDINDRGMIVGYVETGPIQSLACLWEDGRCIDLNTLIPPASGWKLSRATAINNKGWIVGSGKFGEETGAFVLIPTVMD